MDKATEHTRNAQRILRDIVSAIASVQNTSHGYIQSEKKAARIEMHNVKYDADIARKKIRELAQLLGIEY